MTYPETLEYLFAKLPMFSRIGAAAYKEDLTNTIKLCGALGNPQEKFKTIHIAGTNGKGSTSHMLAAILQTAGYKTGLYTSPHLRDFRERIKLNGAMCQEDFVVQFVEKIKPLIEDIEPSFFEITVAMAFEYFATQRVDIAVIETGLGGRLDSTNVIHPELCVITNIGWDHMQLLGNTLPAIALEKAGIMKPGVPVVIGETLSETKQVFKKHAADTGAPIFYADSRYYIDDYSFNFDHLVVRIAETAKNEKRSYKLDLGGIYQMSNLVTVLEAVHHLQMQDWQIEQSHIEEALQHVKRLTGLHGRWEVVKQKPKIVLDVAHNSEGIKRIVQQLEHSSFNHLHIIMGMVKDKDVEKVLELLPKHASYCFTRAQIPRAMDENELTKRAEGIGLKGKSFPEVNQAIKEVLTHAKEDDMILVCGSVFVVAEVNL